MKIDLHNHSTFSDGELTPTELVDWAVERELKAFGITDHNTIDGISQAVKYAKNKNIEFIPGIEFSVKENYYDREIHIIGLFIDYQNSKLTNLIQNYKSYEISNPGKRHSEGLESVINAINDSKGLSFLAHPEFLKSFQKRIIKDFRSLGGDGMEVNYNYNPPFKKEMIPKLDEKYRKIAEENNFIISGGGDFHIRKDLRPIGMCGLTEKEFLQMKEYLRLKY